MNLREFYNKVQRVEEAVNDAFPVVISLATADGGRPGTLTEVSRGLAAKLIVQGLVQLASEVDARVFRTKNAEGKRAAEMAAAASKLQVTVIPTSDFQKLKNATTTKE